MNHTLRLPRVIVCRLTPRRQTSVFRAELVIYSARLYCTVQYTTGTVSSTNFAGQVLRIADLNANTTPFERTRRQEQLLSKVQAISAAAAGTFTIGGDLTVNRMGYGAMRITGPGIWGPPADKAAALATLDEPSNSV